MSYRGVVKNDVCRNKLSLITSVGQLRCRFPDQRRLILSIFLQTDTAYNSEWETYNLKVKGRLCVCVCMSVRLSVCRHIETGVHLGADIVWLHGGATGFIPAVLGPYLMFYFCIICRILFFVLRFGRYAAERLLV